MKEQEIRPIIYIYIYIYIYIIFNLSIMHIIYIYIYIYIYISFAFSLGPLPVAGLGGLRLCRRADLRLGGGGRLAGSGASAGSLGMPSGFQVCLRADAAARARPADARPPAGGEGSWDVEGPGRGGREERGGKWGWWSRGGGGAVGPRWQCVGNAGSAGRLSPDRGWTSRLSPKLSRETVPPRDIGRSAAAQAAADPRGGGCSTPPTLRRRRRRRQGADRATGMVMSAAEKARRAAAAAARRTSGLSVSAKAELDG
jgi:hypothetical protein